MLPRYFNTVTVYQSETYIDEKKKHLFLSFTEQSTTVYGMIFLWIIFNIYIFLSNHCYATLVLKHLRNMFFHNLLGLMNASTEVPLPERGEEEEHADPSEADIMYIDN